MQIHLDQLGKKYIGKEWILKDVTCTFSTGKSYAITGNNGSGKSTLIQLISGIMPMTRGSITYTNDEGTIEPENIYKYLSYAAPYLELIEEFSLMELLDFHFKFKKTIDGISKNELIEILYLEKSKNKKIQDFSSGMKQRLKLGLAIYTASSITLLDEPTSNLDKTGIAWYMEHVSKILNDRVLLVASNQPNEYEFCTEIHRIEQSKMAEVGK